MVENSQNSRPAKNLALYSITHKIITGLSLPAPNINILKSGQTLSVYGMVIAYKESDSAMN